MVRERMLDLLLLVAERKPRDFTGLGVVFYTSLADLPHLPLGQSLPVGLALPVVGAESVAVALATVSARTSAWHDGFHLVEADTLSLTHLCQFLSPGILTEFCHPPGASPTGARHMTALLASRLQGIECVGLLTNQDELTLFEHGAQVHTAKVK